MSNFIPFSLILQINRTFCLFFKHMTGLSVDTDEPLNVQNYGVGGPIWQRTHAQERDNNNKKIAMILFSVRVLQKFPNFYLAIIQKYCV